MALDCKFYHRFILDGTILVETEFFYNRNNQELNEWMSKLFFEKNKKTKKEKTVDNFTVSLTVEDLKRLEMNYYCSCFVLIVVVFVVVVIYFSFFGSSQKHKRTKSEFLFLIAHCQNCKLTVGCSCHYDPCI